MRCQKNAAQYHTRPETAQVRSRVTAHSSSPKSQGRGVPFVTANAENYGDEFISYITRGRDSTSMRNNMITPSKVTLQEKRLTSAQTHTHVASAAENWGRTPHFLAKKASNPTGETCRCWASEVITMSVLHTRRGTLKHPRRIHVAVVHVC